MGVFMWLEDNNKPIYKQITAYLEDLIFEKKLNPDDAIPSVRNMSVEFKINPQTILKAFNELINQGIIYKKRGMGMYVTHNARKLLITRQKKSYLNAELPRVIKRGINMDISKSEFKEIIDNILKEI